MHPLTLLAALSSAYCATIYCNISETFGDVLIPLPPIRLGDITLTGPNVLISFARATDFGERCTIFAHKESEKPGRANKKFVFSGLHAIVNGAKLPVYFPHYDLVKSLDEAFMRDCKFNFGGYAQERAIKVTAIVGVDRMTAAMRARWESNVPIAHTLSRLGFTGSGGVPDPANPKVTMADVEEVIKIAERYYMSQGLITPSGEITEAGRRAFDRQ